MLNETTAVKTACDVGQRQREKKTWKKGTHKNAKAKCAVYIKRSRIESDIKANKTGELLERQQSRDLIMGVDESSETIIIVDCSYIYFHSSAVVQRSFI